jgi:hypothetical protein
MKKFAAMTLCAAACVACSQPGAEAGVGVRTQQKRAPKTEASPVTLCGKNEAIIFSCQVKNSPKLASLCASNTSPIGQSNVYYAFGIPAKVELHYPDRPTPPREVFQRTHLVYAGPTGAFAYSFSRAGVEYVLYSISGADHFEKQGLLAYRPGEHKPLADLECKEGTVIETESPELTDFTLTWPENSELSAHGLPF